MTSEKIPQLRMTIADISSWRIDWELPAGYESITYGKGLENEWLTIINESFNKEFTLDDWQNVMLAREGYRPDRVFFVREISSGEMCNGSSRQRRRSRTRIPPFCRCETKVGRPQTRLLRILRSNRIIQGRWLHRCRT